MNHDAEIFYRARDRRTKQFEDNSDVFTRPIKIFLGDDVADSKTGQIFALALVNMLSRVHRRLTVFVSPFALKAQSLEAGSDLSPVLHALAKSIDPFIEITIGNAVTVGGNSDEITMGVGVQVPSGLNCYVGWEGGRAEVSLTPLCVGTGDSDRMGAATAACLAAATLFRMTDDSFTFTPRRLNFVERTADDAAGTSSVSGPVDVGTVHVLGAGAVAHGLLYWLREIGVEGRWEIADGDMAEIHNTNRCLGMTAADAGWANGIQSKAGGTNKADVAARLIGAKAHSNWYDESPLVDASRPDLLLPLANERNVRAAVASRGFPIVLHATTSANWTAELHRHIAGRDDCIDCRFPGLAPEFPCSTGPAKPGTVTTFSDIALEAETSGDAALPFLSATAGLMLAIALLQLSPDEPFVSEPDNQWVLFMSLGDRLLQASIHQGAECRHLPDKVARALTHKSLPTRWDDLDKGTN